MTAKTFAPETSGVIVTSKRGQEVSTTLATDVAQTADAIWFTYVRHVFVGRGHATAKPTTRHRAFHSIKGLTTKFISIAEQPELAELFEDRYDADRHVSEVD